MPSIRRSLSSLAAMRRKFDGLLSTAGSSEVKAEGPACHRIAELVGFGANPGNLRMLVHVPSRLPAKPALVVALHGCGQTAAEYNNGTGWATVADRNGFIVVYPEQMSANNPKNCFSWFLPRDTTRDHGEAASIQQMVAHAITKFGVDRQRVYVTGLSAGGAMACVMLATYPEAYAGGAIIAGLPFGSANSAQEALQAMFTDTSPSASTLGDRVRSASGHRGPWPRISVWHGTSDAIVKPSNADHIVRQWTNVHGLLDTPGDSERIGDHRRRVWNDLSGQCVVESYSIVGMGHGVPIDTTADGYGAAGRFFLDAGVSSTHQIAGSWGLIDASAETLGEAASHPSGDLRKAPRGLDVAAPAGRFGTEAGAASSAAPLPDQHPAFGFNRVDTAADQAAGRTGRTAPGDSGGFSPFNPRPIIEAALKAAGLMPR